MLARFSASTEMYLSNEKRGPGCLGYMGFLKWWYPTTMGFPTKHDHFGMFWGYHHLRKHAYIGDYTTQSNGDYHKPLGGSLLNNQDSMESKRVSLVAHLDANISKRW